MGDKNEENEGRKFIIATVFGLFISFFYYWFYGIIPEDYLIRNNLLADVMFYFIFILPIISSSSACFYLKRKWMISIVCGIFVEIIFTIIIIIKSLSFIVSI